MSSLARSKLSFRLAANVEAKVSWGKLKAHPHLSWQLSCIVSNMGMRFSQKQRLHGLTMAIFLVLLCWCCYFFFFFRAMPNQCRSLLGGFCIALAWHWLSPQRTCHGSNKLSKDLNTTYKESDASVNGSWEVRTNYFTWSLTYKNPKKKWNT